MIKVLCDRCQLTIHNEMAFKICMVGKATITDTCILCASCMKQVASDVLEEEKKRVERVKEFLENTREGDNK